MRRGHRLFRPVRCHYGWLSLNYQREKKASGEALAIDMGIPISLVWQVMRSACVVRTSQASLRRHESKTMTSSNCALSNTTGL